MASKISVGEMRAKVHEQLALKGHGHCDVFRPRRRYVRKKQRRGRRRIDPPRYRREFDSPKYQELACRWREIFRPIRRKTNRAQVSAPS